MNKTTIKTSKHILECFGGIANIKQVEKDITRIKILVDSSSLVKREKLTENQNIIGTIKSNEFIEIVMNFEIIDDVYNNIIYTMNKKEQ
ncbi:PTS sugar transporter subunit IIB [Borrelia miyamotoi]|uniref:PTS transporter subunit EIIB n=1 Tax=Borrelia miyamotoi TaxID=47466 RepID=A0AAX3JLR1_9SPIR|nr:PTS transporter subunit EIIB [Borrelia miyamotoi]QFP41965.1 PTS sugar transporter subunit IIB [Borrelia miyamotoi]QFP48082.1 PTS transporter subunit EIIB [Borrelia miyamotoi]QGT55842.1 PTS sugar transporter subunit IIB [Borrelia miyamotoi]QGT56621.1 PTS sugar transporter subunit IIB [Borrelia miyamotoi]WAZ71880.1 PTS transporter subunit EIIB [Borrelia miyamotoi]